MKTAAKPYKSFGLLIIALILSSCGGGGGGGGSLGPSATAPGAPTIGTASPFDKSLSVSFTAPASNGGAAISTYTVTCTAGSEAKTAAGASSPLLVSGLTNNTAYSCSVTATNSVGTSPASASVTGTPVPQPKPLSATPILGGFGAGATVDLFRADTGERIESKTTGSDGTINVSVPASYTGLAIVRVSGSGSALYLDERTDTLKPFTSSQFLLAVIPPGATREQGVPLAVTTVTHAIALAAGVNTTASATTIAVPSLTDAALQSAQNRVMDALGLTLTAFDPLKVPVYLKAADQGKGTKLDGSGESLNYGVILIALAKLAPSGTDLATFAQTLGTAIKSGTLGADVPQIGDLPQLVNTAKTDFVASGSQSQVTVTPEPILVKTSVSVGGTLSPSSVTARKGISVKLRVLPAVGYELNTISGCDGTLSGDEYTTGSLSTACTVAATFKLKRYNVTAIAGTGGTITPPSVSIEHGSRGTFTLAAATDYIIASASGCAGSLSGSTYTTGPVTGACEVTASFVRVYSITATVSGLSGTGLVLQNNGATDVEVSGNGTVSINSAAASGSPYALTVKTQPTSPTQTCTVANGSGTVTNANVSNIAVTCTTNTYQITGTVSGLSGTGLVLQNNGATDIAVSGNGTVNINSSAASGSAYALTVKTQPNSPTQTCTVANGSGTVTNANVSNISVTCTTNTYQITGTVSGLSGTGLVLQNNGATDIAVSGNGTVSINSLAASGSAYAVTVKTQPTWPNQTCVVANGSGTVTNANVSNISVTCTTNAYQITATVSGLSGTGLVLQNNGTTELAINSNGTFVINSAAASGSVYAVTVKTQPTTPSQTCVVVNGAGTIGGVNVSDITVNCATNMYAVSATVSGLSGTGLVLQNNGATDLPVSSNGTVVISNLAVSGSPYAVTVKAQPSSPTQTCVVANGSGTVTTATINNISISCTTNTYQITATVSGLSGTGLVLQNNAANDLSFTTNGTFTINAAAQSGSTYAVTVKTQPTSPIQICVVANGSGAITSSNVSNITVSCAAPSPPTITSAPTMTLYVVGVAASSVTGTFVATDSANLPISYSISTPASKGTAAINSSTGVMTYTLAGHPSPITATGDSFVVSASNGATSSTATITVNLNGDPLLPNQWYLQNTGQDAFSTFLPTAGFDIDVGSAWAAGYSGSGIKVAVIDSGLEIAHEDLIVNIDALKSLNFVTGSNDTTIAGPSDHGTQVAGIIAASAFNNKGGRGIAYNARLRGYNLLAQPSVRTTDNLVKAMGGIAISADNDIFNQSFGVGANSINKAIEEYSPTQGNINFNLTTLRGGLGAIGIQSSGNEFIDQDGDLRTCGYANSFGISCGHVATDTRRASTYPIVVGATSADGKKASYSTTGASIWISAPGGEGGASSSYVSSPNPTDFRPAIVTTTSSGCGNYAQSFNPLDSRGASVFSAQCQYTAMMNGTSAAAPVVSGVVALMLEANPRLSYRDVKHILANTATRVDESFLPITRAGLLSSGALMTLEQGWTRNAAGYYFHNWYGFGEVDAGRAVTAARGYSSYLPPRSENAPSFSLLATQSIVIGPASSYSFTASVTAGFSFVEGILVYMNFDTPGLYCNQVEVTSPAGTKSILLNGGAGFAQQAVRNARLASNAFYGESAFGVWRVTYYNLCNASIGSTVLPTGSEQQLIFVGY